MIAQLLNREFLLKSIQKLSQNLAQEANLQAQGNQAALERAAQTEVSSEDLKEAEAMLRDITQQGIADPAAAEDERAFFPRDARASVVQSALQEFYQTHQSEMIETDPTRGAVGGEVLVSDQQLKGLSLSGEDSRGLFGAFEEADVGWAACLMAMGVRKLRGKHPFNPQPAPPLPISNQARILLVGDWGSGLPRAQKVGAAMRQVLLESGAENRQQHVIHLGDVYYSGWKSEYENHFLPYWPVKPGEEDRITSWSVNANHDMYSGGADYFDYLLKDPRFAKQAQSSFFSLENEHWKILGLDTGYEEHDLAGGQATWVDQELAQTPKKNGLLLSHHQMFSAYEGDGSKLENKLRPVLDAGRIRSWFWGHEHRCVCYKPQHGIEYARLIGHGGIPVWASEKQPPAGVAYEYTESHNTGWEQWAMFGFTVLDFDDQQIRVRYINENGTKHHEEILHAR